MRHATLAAVLCARVVLGGRNVPTFPAADQEHQAVSPRAAGAWTHQAEVDVLTVRGVLCGAGWDLSPRAPTPHALAQTPPLLAAASRTSRARADLFERRGGGERRKPGVAGAVRTSQRLQAEPPPAYPLTRSPHIRRLCRSALHSLVGDSTQLYSSDGQDGVRVPSRLHVRRLSEARTAATRVLLKADASKKEKRKDDDERSEKRGGHSPPPPGPRPPRRSPPHPPPSPPPPSPAPPPPSPEPPRCDGRAMRQCQAAIARLTRLASALQPTSA